MEDGDYECRKMPLPYILYIKMDIAVVVALIGEQSPAVKYFRCC